MEVCPPKVYQGLHPVDRHSSGLQLASDSWDSEKVLNETPQNLKSEVEGSPVPLKKWLLAIFLLILVIVIGIVAGILVTRKNNSGTTSASSDSTDASTATITLNPPPGSTSSAAADVASPSASPDIQTKSRAFNGTGIASVFPHNGNDLFWLIYQDYTGDLKYLALGTNNVWQPSKSLGITNVMNGTRLTADAYSYEETLARVRAYASETGAS